MLNQYECTKKLMHLEDENFEIRKGTERESLYFTGLPVMFYSGHSGRLSMIERRELILLSMQIDSVIKQIIQTKKQIFGTGHDMVFMNEEELLLDASSKEKKVYLCKPIELFKRDKIRPKIASDLKFNYVQYKEAFHGGKFEDNRKYNNYLIHQYDPHCKYLSDSHPEKYKLIKDILKYPSQ